MRLTKLVAFLSVAVVVASLAVVAVEAQKGDNVQDKVKNPYIEITGQAQAKVAGPTIRFDEPLPEVNAATSTEWRLHNLDLVQTRYVALDQINTSNARSLSPRWLFQTGSVAAGFHTTPLVID